MISDEYRKITAQHLGEMIWHDYGISHPAKLCLEDLAFAEKVHIVEGKLNGMDARLIKKGNKGIIRIREDIPEPGRKRFAICHELGHWKLHADKTQLFSCTEKDMFDKYKGSIEEIEANYFAAGLLMPSKFFLEEMKQHPMKMSTISYLATLFGVSLTSAAIRFTELSNDYCAIVCSAKGVVKWFAGSKSFNETFWIVPGKKLSRNTITCGLFEGTGMQGSSVTDISDWSDRNNCYGQREFVEDAILMNKYNQVLTLLRLP